MKSTISLPFNFNLDCVEKFSLFLLVFLMKIHSQVVFDPFDNFFQNEYAYSTENRKFTYWIGFFSQYAFVYTNTFKKKLLKLSYLFTPKSYMEFTRKGLKTDDTKQRDVNPLDFSLSWEFALQYN